MRTRTFLALTVATAVIGSAGAASAQDWQGFYAGGFAGYAKVQGQDNERILFDTNLDGNFDDTVRAMNATTGPDAFSPGFCDGSPNANNAAAGCLDDKDDGGELGGRVGYDVQSGNFVFGGLLEFGKPDGEDSVSAFSTTPANYSFEQQLDYLAAARIRLGYAVGRFLPYVTGGYASGNVNSTYSTSNAANSFDPLKRDDTAEGFQVGGGIETRVASNISVGLEYIYTDLDVDAHIVRTGPGTAPATNPFLLRNPLGTDQRRSGDSLELHSFRLTAALRF